MNMNMYRPEFHFTPETNWMNDPNGMVYFDGEYHLFYQHHPYGTTWGPMHWGHAVSTDLVHWQRLPIALAPDEHGQIFSGSAIVDWNDTSGFFGGKPGLVAVFTHHNDEAAEAGQRERQSLAYSRDSGRTWTKYSGNPVLEDERYADYRDPKVFWYAAAEQWIMILATGQTVCIYSSPNLKEWTLASEFGEGQGSHDGVWECPDIFELPIEGEVAGSKWVMLVSIGAVPEIVEGSRTQYFVGNFDGKSFTCEQDPDTVRWVDYGRDNYAGVSFSDMPEEDGRRIYIGWMSNWRYANLTPTEGWRSAMTIPRTLSLKAESGGFALIQRPVAELEKLKTESTLKQDVLLEEGCNPFSRMTSRCCQIVAEFELGSAEEFGFKVRASKDHATIVGYDIRNRELFIDRTSSGDISFHQDFAGRHSVHLEPKDHKVRIELWIDNSSVEAFGGEGEAVMTDLIYPEAGDDGLELYARGGSTRIISLEVSALHSIW